VILFVVNFDHFAITIYFLKVPSKNGQGNFFEIFHETKIPHISRKKLMKSPRFFFFN